MITKLFPRTESAYGPGSLRIHLSSESERSGKRPLQSISVLEIICSHDLERLSFEVEFEILQQFCFLGASVENVFQRFATRICS